MTTSVQATFAATVVDEWWRYGVRHALICPGSRSTPMAIALYRSPMETHVVLDERCAGFMALGLAKATGMAVAVLTTSGTAAAELHPSVVEAHHGGVPLVAVTADRPPELHGVGAPQTCDQRGLYGTAVRWEHDPGVPRSEASGSWRSLGARSIAEAVAGPAGPGPVHLNLPFCEPLVGEAGELPEGRAGGEPWHVCIAAPVAPPREVVEELAAMAGRCGVVIAGHQPGVDQAEYRDALVSLASALGWPLLADPVSGGRRAPSGSAVGARRVPIARNGTPLGYGHVIAAADALLGCSAFAELARPEVIVRFGRPWASRVVAEWAASSGAREVHIDPWWSWSDPGRAASLMVRCDPIALCREVVASMDGSSTDGSRCGGKLVGKMAGSGHALPHGTGGSEWLDLWIGAEAAAQSAIDAVLAGEGFAEPWIARELAAVMAESEALVVSSSMPVREVEWFSAPRPGYPVVLASRGVNGIDGVVSTACGVALSGVFDRVVCLLGDLAFLHDAGALGGVPADLPLTVVVVDNRGGAIFDFLPQGDLEPELYGALFRAPQRTDPAALAAAHGARFDEVSDRDGFTKALAGSALIAGERCARVIVCRVDPGSTLRVHKVIGKAVDEALAGVLG